MKNPVSLYIHIPFCVRKCLYCDFLSFGSMDKYFEDYVNALCEEIKQNASDYSDRTVSTIFIGGGTPTILKPKEIGKIMDAVMSKYDVADNAEITIESNPGTMDRAKLNELKQMYINRLSIGLQAWQDRLLKRLGRIHSCEDFRRNYIEAREVGFKNINVDLMFSLPGQTVADWKETLNNVIFLNPEHISAYSLIVEENTPFYDMRESGAIKETDEDTDRDMYYSARDILSGFGYNRYEISNFAKEGFESRHNEVYWRTEEYRGFGLGSHSYTDGERYHNTTDFGEYIISKGEIKRLVKDIEILTEDEKQEEFMFMGLRMSEGVSDDIFKRRFSKSIYDVYGNEINELKSEGLLLSDKGRLFLSDRGIDVSNQVFEKFIKY